MKTSRSRPPPRPICRRAPSVPDRTETCRIVPNRAGPSRFVPVRADPCRNVQKRTGLDSCKGLALNALRLSVPRDGDFSMIRDARAEAICRAPVALPARGRPRSSYAVVKDRNGGQCASGIACFGLLAGGRVAASSGGLLQPPVRPGAYVELPPAVLATPGRAGRKEYPTYRLASDGAAHFCASASVGANGRPTARKEAVTTRPLGVL